MTTPRPSRRTSVHHTAWPARPARAGIALDLGSSRTRAWALGRGLILDAPTELPGERGPHRLVQRGAIVDPAGTARMLHRLLGHRVPAAERPLIIITTPVHDRAAYRGAALAALRLLRPRTVLTTTVPRAIAVGAGADLSRPLLIVDLGAHLTEVFLLADGDVVDAHRTPRGTSDLADGTTPRQLTASVVTAVTDMLTRDPTSRTLDALQHGVLLAGGGALRPEITYRLAIQLRVPVRSAPAPHTAAVRGAARLLETARTHPSATGFLPPPQRRR
ncbi:hypothetical protein AQ490_16735 [Wenjunlia vitaminophila]|uniref:Rod shape-determining protein MreB n=1 Tax=Wenjunlia vitaminophila TaxID=76728 RepID=A0A0T6LXV2_WENVI|nr:rod shape-determining protein [Wenjunlia vitaminophila]KRV50661.1 hypothetical protein AQ490_16580 [Wenjunlia vitaminophila]KRV50690.1 hypothetical protein AQ490_16735 [Wenjunlia vitaminophila]